LRIGVVGEGKEGMVSGWLLFGIVDIGLKLLGVVVVAAVVGVIERRRVWV
jgi:hypothetical protein